MPTRTQSERHPISQQTSRLQAGPDAPDLRLGRFMSADPLVTDFSNGQSFNRYSYVENNPTNFIDPSGFAKGCVEIQGGPAGTNGKTCTDFDDIKDTKSGASGGGANGGGGRAGSRAQQSAKMGGTYQQRAANNQSTYDRLSTWTHVGLSGLGTIPAFGVIPDVADLLLIAGEIPFGKSDGTDLTLASAGVIATVSPVVGDSVAAGAKIARRLGKDAGTAANLAKQEKQIEALAKTSMLGERGTQTASKTVWKGEGKARINVENPNPGQRPGQIHYQENYGNKYIYDPISKSFPDAPNSVNRLLNDKNFARGIEKAMTNI